MVISLPRGIGLVLVGWPGAPLVVVSDRLTDRERRTAKAIAYILNRRGEHIVVLRESLIAEADAA